VFIGVSGGTQYFWEEQQQIKMASGLSTADTSLLGLRPNGGRKRWNRGEPAGYTSTNFAFQSAAHPPGTLQRTREENHEISTSTTAQMSYVYIIDLSF
jgi:hypothetical protein